MQRTFESCRRFTYTGRDFEVSIFDGISQAFFDLGDLSAQVYDYWISELYTEDGDLDWSEWNEENLRLMKLDVTILSEQQ